MPDTTVSSTSEQTDVAATEQTNDYFSEQARANRTQQIEELRAREYASIPLSYRISHMLLTDDVATSVGRSTGLVGVIGLAYAVPLVIEFLEGALVGAGAYWLYKNYVKGKR